MASGLAFRVAGSRGAHSGRILYAPFDPDPSRAYVAIQRARGNTVRPGEVRRIPPPRRYAAVMRDALPAENAELTGTIAIPGHALRSFVVEVAESRRRRDGSWTFAILAEREAPASRYRTSLPTMTMIVDTACGMNIIHHPDECDSIDRASPAP